MENKKRDRNIDVSLVILGTLVILAFAMALWKGGWQLTLASLTMSARLLEKVWIRLLLGFLLGGFIQVLIPREFVTKWLGAGSGLKGILLGSYMGIFTAGGPYVWLPVVASMYRSGADIGSVLSLLSARGILGIQMLLIWQVPFFGLELSLARYIPCLFVPPIVGLLGRGLFNIFHWSTLSPDALKELPPVEEFRKNGLKREKAP